MGKYDLWVNMIYGLIWIVGEYEFWVNMIYVKIWIIGQYEWWVNMIYVYIWIMGEYELLVGGQTKTHTLVHQYHDSAWPIYRKCIWALPSKLHSQYLTAGRNRINFRKLRHSFDKLSHYIFFFIILKENLVS